MKSVLTIVIIEDHKMVLEGLRLSLSQVEEMDIKRTFTDARDALNYLVTNPVDIVLCDIRMLPMDGIAFMEALKKKCPLQKCIALTSIDNFQQLEQCRSVGFSGYVMKNASIEELCLVIRKVSNGATHFQERLCYSPKQSMEQSPFKVLFNRLSPSEKKVCLLLIDGLNVQDIALRTFKSIETIRTQKKSIHQKLNVSTTQELMRIVLDEFHFSAD